MKENKKVKMVAILGLIIVIVIGLMIMVLTKENGNKKVKRWNELGNNEIVVDIDDLDFSTTFLKLENQKKNMIYSPLSIKYALKMLEEGASGNTKTQIDNVVGSLNLIKYENIEDVLSLANAVYIRDNYEKNVKEEYTKLLQEKYDAEVKIDDFKSAQKINDWIENKTLGIIKSMLTDNQVSNPDNKMILVNALAIDMEWKVKFSAESTYGKTFYKDNGAKIQATTMNQESSSNKISYYKDNHITSLTMELKKYEDTELEFIAIMPNEKLSKYVEDFTEKDLNHVIENSISASDTKDGVDISIPKFSFDYDLSLKTDLMALGITDAFNSSADFSNMSTSEGLFVGDALHKADIEFSEDGIKAAAVTTFLTLDMAMEIEPKRPVEITIDKPFLYVIRDKNNGEIWFIGTVYEPNLWENDREEYHR